jgi:hypothetical protein
LGLRGRRFVPKACDDALAKLNEARFFLEVMTSVENSRAPLLQGYTSRQEYVYLLSAFVGACYSVTEYLWHGVKAARHAAESFRLQHKDIYGDGPTGGLRTQTVHFHPVVPQREGYKPPQGDQVNFELREYQPPHGNQVNFEFKNEYYLTEDASEKPITRLCENHLAELGALVKQYCQ